MWGHLPTPGRALPQEASVVATEVHQSHVPARDTVGAPLPALHLQDLPRHLTQPSSPRLPTWLMAEHVEGTRPGPRLPNAGPLPWVVFAWSPPHPGQDGPWAVLSLGLSFLVHKMGKLKPTLDI